MISCVHGDLKIKVWQVCIFGKQIFSLGKVFECRFSSIEDCGGALTAYSLQDFASSLDEMAEKLALPFIQSQISMHLDP